MFSRKYFLTVAFSVLLTGMNLSSQIVLQGVVTDNGLEPVEKALVELIDKADTNRKFNVYTDTQGHYVIQIEGTNVEDGHSQNPSTITLFQNCPNPFNPATIIAYAIPKPANIRIEIFNVLGQRIKTLFDGLKTEAAGQVMWDGRDDLGRGAAAGVYIYSLISEGVRINKKMILVDGQGGTLSITKLQLEQLLLSDQNTLNKQTSDEYLFRVSGSNVETYEQQNFVVTSNMVYDVKVTRTVRDADDNVYKTVKIDNQWWMAENLKVTHYRDGRLIPHVTDAIEWMSSTSGAWCSYNNDEKNVATYGRLYNWYTLIDEAGVAPEGWHVPSDAEWQQLEIYLGMTQEQADSVARYRGTNEGGKLKEAGTVHWHSPNEGANNESGFSALPGGHRSASSNIFIAFSDYAFFWSTSDGPGPFVFRKVYRTLSYGSSRIYRGVFPEGNGLSIRCVKD